MTVAQIVEYIFFNPPAQTVSGITASLIMGCLLEITGYVLASKIVCTLIISIMIVITTIVFFVMLYRFYNRDIKDDKHITISIAVDFYIEFVIVSGLLCFMLWLWGQDALWRGIELAYDHAPTHNAPPFRIIFVFVYTSSMVFGGAGISRYFPIHWVSELALIIISIANTLVMILIMGVAISLGLQRIEKSYMSRMKRKQPIRSASSSSSSGMLGKEKINLCTNF